MRTEQAYVDWIRRYILFHRKRHPNEMGEKEIDGSLDGFAELDVGDGAARVVEKLCAGGAFIGVRGDGGGSRSWRFWCNDQGRRFALPSAFLFAHFQCSIRVRPFVQNQNDSQYKSGAVQVRFAKE